MAYDWIANLRLLLANGLITPQQYAERLAAGDKDWRN